MSTKNFNPLQVKQNLCQGASDIISSDDRGQVKESGFSISDTATTDLSHVIRTAAGMEALLDGKIDAVDPAVAGHIPQLTADGQLVDSGLVVDDAALPGPAILYSSQKLQSDFMKLVPPAVVSDVAIFGPGGQVVDSAFKLDDSAAPAANVLYSSLKLLTKVYLQGAFSATVIPSPSTEVLLPAVATVDPEGTWNGSQFTAPRDGLYLATAFLRLTDTQALAETWYQFVAFGPTKFTANRIIVSSTMTGAAGNDSLWSNISDVFPLSAGQQIYFAFTHNTGFTKTVFSSQFSISEL